MSCCCGSQFKTKSHTKLNACSCQVNYKSCQCPNLFSGKKLLRKNPASKRIRYLAIPKKRTSKYNKCTIGPYGRKIEIIREPKISTRLEQLAVPTVRTLISARDEYKSFINSIWYNRFNRAIHKSMFTMYSRLANVQLPTIKASHKKWTQADWDRHNAWLAQRALPKKVKKGPPVKRVWKPIEELKRIDDLSRPKQIQKKFSGSSIPTTNVKQSAIDYTPTERICLLSMPKHPRVKGKDEECTPRGVSRGARQYKPTERIETLAQPKKYKNAESDQKDNPFTVSPNALKAKPSERIIELSKPKNYEGY